jgi:hypothetical protein
VRIRMRCFVLIENGDTSAFAGQTAELALHIYKSGPSGTQPLYVGIGGMEIVPEPSSFILLALGGFALWVRTMRKTEWLDREFGVSPEPARIFHTEHKTVRPLHTP